MKDYILPAEHLNVRSTWTKNQFGSLLISGRISALVAYSIGTAIRSQNLLLEWFCSACAFHTRTLNPRIHKPHFCFKSRSPTSVEPKIWLDYFHRTTTPAGEICRRANCPMSDLLTERGRLVSFIAIVLVLLFTWLVGARECRRLVSQKRLTGVSQTHWRMLDAGTLSSPETERRSVHPLGAARFAQGNRRTTPNLASRQPTTNKTLVMLVRYNILTFYTSSYLSNQFSSFNESTNFCTHKSVSLNPIQLPNNRLCKNTCFSSLFSSLFNLQIFFFFFKV